ncbi:MAG: 1-deoxy-D-xylulose-5-phosphate synthase N-terminal domain-containing protein [Ignavibacteria bacterium]|nr:1-deoxy-D-xylulose-5-phosphate synthase N-terminal domain-containing protein [Ignavibacteria bacterium]
MGKIDIDNLKKTALRVRENIIRMASGGGNFVSSSLSCTDILVFLYGQFLNVNKDNLNDPARDFFFLSKGHNVSALYSVLAENGIIAKERLKNHLLTSDFIYWQPNINIPGVEFHSGSLGHLLSIAAGAAMDCKLRNQNNRVVVLMGDGELNEGSIWEAALIAGSRKTDNLIAVIDRNKFQANSGTEELIKLESIQEKFKSFRWSVKTADGHDFTSLSRAFSRIPIEAGRPSLIIANTIRGRGIPSIESRTDRWFADFSNDEIDVLVKELYKK